MNTGPDHDHQLVAALEALLFVHGDPLDVKKIASVLKTEASNVEGAIATLAGHLEQEGRGLMLVRQESRVQLATKPAFSSLVEYLVKDAFEENLTPAALETLSLIAYLGPISRARVDYLRGVNSSYSIRNLLMRGLVEKTVDPQSAHVTAYRVSFDLLKHLGVSSIEDLPDYGKYKEQEI
ncbi:MAG: Condensin subunit ScpB [Candidatus Wolfebacteria bacterium GW2011_GWE1_48_7]|uniref:Condensin subunit ScpB, segregation and condensation protein B n=1 Tax=Candidatus Wolfebacteria bacterium GW2011_GWB1_47_1 TaxID=1619007 RepID=A0A0G4AST6_9BACT|nr:MAG: condensin subunit ScpB, segregation and condensation protein B [Candidatus Wolfebacteria bacterium GW2011_GWB1_47_1]KKU37149.1 MAG: Condensin subunit ScpB [Candidatus Wolfebacteria bacterium GW2011_GWC2_46_275]KKU42691.1 MAG: Condensin subunit ScpB [Candidatus Wolfebacteria bacterium GW2011_GWB2_46_69]KKU54574.1 MAG: Condensin subunit ScpB [Candidatus Wolfebacteria bacterium GW2011_GWC1_47_103]KKU59958.1 MAG: Condensin subunit ScpB [Candidatus Wolfebacteria bacterium GW2011_GWE2_47_12]